MGRVECSHVPKPSQLGPRGVGGLPQKKAPAIQRIFPVADNPSSRQGRGGKQSPFTAGGQICGDAPGLVHSQTSVTPYVVELAASRLHRMKRGTLTSARLHQQQVAQSGFRFYAAMLTLTYAPAAEWSPSHVSHLLRCVRQWCRRRKTECRYVWVLELTKAGRPHYHIVFWLPRGMSLPKPDKQGWWPHGYTQIASARNPVGYLVKYSSKGNGDAKFPKAARIYGSGGLSLKSRNERTWWLSPAWVRKHFPLPSMRLRRVFGGGWLCLDTGEWVPSPYRVVFDRGRVFVYLKSADGLPG
jgi:hypothetical protein